MRAYTAALGGNVLTSFYITQLMLQDNAHKNQVNVDDTFMSEMFYKLREVVNIIIFLSGSMSSICRWRCSPHNVLINNSL